MWRNGDAGLEELDVGQLYCASIVVEHTEMRCRSDVEGFGKVCILVYWVRQDPDAGGAGEQGGGGRGTGEE
jgi:hypothetical protein